MSRQSTHPMSNGHYDPLRREIERMQRYADLISTPVQRILEDQRRLTEMVMGPACEWQRMMASVAVSPSFSAVRRMAEEREALIAQTKLYDVSHNLEAAARTWTASFDGIRRQVEEATRITDEIRWASQIAEEAASFSAISETNLRLMELAGATLHDRLTMFEAAQTIAEREAVLPSLLRALIDWVDTLPQAGISKQTVRRVVELLMFVATAYGLVSDHMFQEDVEEWREKESAFHEEVEGLLEELAGKVDALAPAVEARTFRTTVPLPLRVAPQGKARRLGTVPVDILLEEADHQGRWLSIVYLDQKSGMPVSGWVYKRGLVVADTAVEEEGTGGPP